MRSHGHHIKPQLHVKSLLRVSQFTILWAEDIIERVHRYNYHPWNVQIFQNASDVPYVSDGSLLAMSYSEETSDLLSNTGLSTCTST
jgi:hypothetical protein